MSSYRPGIQHFTPLHCLLPSNIQRPSSPASPLQSLPKRANDRSIRMPMFRVDLPCRQRSYTKNTSVPILEERIWCYTHGKTDLEELDVPIFRRGMLRFRAQVKVNSENYRSVFERTPCSVKHADLRAGSNAQSLPFLKRSLGSVHL